ncbi:hypothetical protein C8Q74DRAFT_1213887 [Fomes fomentarius]|nr:hypothetical protein C8Q74DRAFT_1213887 [Fomes fomentarius]
MPLRLHTLRFTNRSDKPSVAILKANMIRRIVDVARRTLDLRLRLRAFNLKTERTSWAELGPARSKGEAQLLGGCSTDQKDSESDCMGGRPRSQSRGVPVVPQQWSGGEAFQEGEEGSIQDSEEANHCRQSVQQLERDRNSIHSSDGPSSESEGSEESASDETAVPTSGSVTPNIALGAESAGIDGSLLFDPAYFDRPNASLTRSEEDACGIRLVQKSTRSPAHWESRRYDAVLALPSFRPVHPAMAFNDEGF